MKTFKDKYGKSKDPSFETRMEVLVKATDKHIGRIDKYSNKDLL